MDTNKIVVCVIWVAAIAAMLFASGFAATAGKFLFWALIIAHLAEFLIKRSVMEKAGGSMAHHFVQTMIFGLFHWKPLEEAQGGGE